MRRSGLIILTTLLLAGCGGDEEKQVRATLAADREASEQQDWDAVCALRTEAARRELGLCAPDHHAGAVAFRAGPGRVTAVRVDGDQATARYEGGSVERLRKMDDRWLLDAPADEEQIRGTLDAYDRAYVSGDFGAACAFMTEAAQRELMRHDPSGCGARSTPEPGEFGVSEAELVLELGDLQRIEIHGDTAQAHYDRSVTTLRKVDGRWLID